MPIALVLGGLSIDDKCPAISYTSAIYDQNEHAQKWYAKATRRRDSLPDGFEYDGNCGYSAGSLKVWTLCAARAMVSAALT